MFLQDFKFWRSLKKARIKHRGKQQHCKIISKRETEKSNLENSKSYLKNKENSVLVL